VGKAIMLQGTSSNVGKSVLATALCRIFAQDGYRVAPFKAQNMSNNSYVTEDGLEIGRAQGVQAEAAGVRAEAIMNPVLVKPSGENTAQVVLLGKPLMTVGARGYGEEYVPRVLPVVRRSLEELLRRFDIVVIEGAGSPAEVNLRDRDIANMTVAEMARAPVLLVGDIDRGGVLASLVGTMELLAPAERAMVRGFLINKFRGDLELLRPGLEFLADRTGVPVLGVIPWIDPGLVEAEDAVVLTERRGPEQGEVTVAALVLPRISNFTDLDPLERTPGVILRLVRRGEPLGEPDAVIIPGTKYTVGDLQYLVENGYAAEIRALAARGIPVVGICGGYQMLGRRILDPEGVESSVPEVEGLGLLDVETVFVPEKEVLRVEGEVCGGFLAAAHGAPVRGYEIHMGRTTRGPGARPWIRLRRRGQEEVSLEEGAASGRVLGTYLHDIFANRDFRLAFVNYLRVRKGLGPVSGGDVDREEAYDLLARTVRESLDMQAIYSLLA